MLISKYKWNIHCMLVITLDLGDIQLGKSTSQLTLFVYKYYVI